ncbi:replication factor C / DNA polymerase III gamma-tau subunit, putative [Entamoeba invadens IP1]|uniref:Replication factor C / DNA polymerase III gamma-tau subunit, putative n=1 Tax=Entamoeba invadens IP1 TaxID=370355 RepID=A0A0A1TWP3_ENTIV|nr:replication factor C / DNA polymerase III gamma-tau subunit, putative [Entamoeba invadens IP1]ELP85612.1 replication factor C / DNA polymerase III gamma-tau subunit, putative [Entamoeba invadens IP1]|eukprot:XP_004184958.1 replication factor C / DNA polymerase III gamma-tau subunit, putative [Entamoeba invadens IP1]
MFVNGPRAFSSLDYAKEANTLLDNLSHCDNIPHLLIHGGDGSGRYTRAMLFLQNIYGKGVYNIESGVTQIVVNNMKEDVKVRSSLFHVEIVPSDLFNGDNEIIQEFVKSLTNIQTLTSLFQKLTSGKPPPRYRVIMLFEADSLSYEAQQSLRRTMEVGSTYCRFILFCSNVCGMLQPIRSRCILVRVPYPNKKSFKSLSKKLKVEKKVIEMAKGNLKEVAALIEQKKILGVITPPLLEQLVHEITRSLMQLKSIEHTTTLAIDALTLVDPRVLLRNISCCLMEEKSISEGDKIKIMKTTASCGRNLFLAQDPSKHFAAFFANIETILTPPIDLNEGEGL